MSFCRSVTNSVTNSELRVNESKTELCLFQRGDTTPITISLDGANIISNRTINVLGVIFDSKLTWADHISHAIKLSNKALNAIQIIKRFFSKRELLSLVTSNFYSILYYFHDDAPRFDDGLTDDSISF